MKTISVALDAHLAGGTTTMARCWKVTRQDATVFGFTSADKDIIFGGVVYKASTGMTPSSIQGSDDLAVPNLEVQGVLQGESLTEADIQAGLWDFATVEIFEVNYNDLTQGALNLQTGTIGGITMSRQHFVAELRGLAQQLQQQVGELYSASCRAELGDTRCGVNIASYTVTDTVTAVTDNRTFVASAIAGATGYFDYGKITFTSGANIGLSMEIKSFTTGGAFVLQLKMPYTVAPGDTFSVYPGCNKLLKTAVATYGGDCKVKFNNVVNFRGEPDVPGMDALLKPAGTK